MQLIEGAESVGSWPALSEVAQKARKEAEKENKPVCGGGGDVGGGGGGGEEGEGGKVAGKDKRGGSGGGGGGGERRVSGGGGTVGGGGGGGGGGTMEKANENEANGDGQRFSGRRKGIYTCRDSLYRSKVTMDVRYYTCTML